MSEEFKPEYKIFEDINLENNKIINVSEISSYDGKTGKYNSDVNNSGLYIHTPGKPTTVSKPNNDKGLIITTGHAQTRLDEVENISNTINNTVKDHLDVKSNTQTDFISPIIDIKSADSPNTEVLIRNVKSSDTNDNGITITTDRTKIISTKSRNKTSRENSNAVILDFSNKVSSHIDLYRADIYQANTQIFVAGTTYGYPDNNEDITDGENDSTIGNALYVDTKNVNIYVPTKIIGNTSISGKLTQSGNVEINADKYGESDPFTTIDGSSLKVNTRVVNIGNLTSSSVDVKTKEINIGTSDTNSTSRNILKIGSNYSDLTITGRDFLIDSDTTKIANTSVDDSVNNTAKSYLRSYYINSNDSYIHDLLTIGSNNSELANSTSHLQVNGYADITGNLDVDGDIDVKNTIYLHNSGSEDSTTSYIKSNENNDSLQINNDTEVIISNAPNDGNDLNQISIKDTLIKTSKKLDLNASQEIEGTLTFDGNKDIKDLNYIKTDILEVSNNSDDNSKNIILNINTSSDNEKFIVDAKTISLTSINGNDNVSIGTINTGRFEQTGNTYINTGDISNTTDIEGENAYINPKNVYIGNSDDNSDDTTTFTEKINIGYSNSKKSGTDVTIKGKNNFELESGTNESRITVDKVSISNSTDSNKVNIYWDPASSTLIFEKG